MAKVIAPLLSGSARGQIMKSLVFFPWKSIKAVRGYVIPANPNTSAQQAQRTKMTDAVDGWHDISWSEADKTAWNLFASALAAVMSGFNAFVKTHIDSVIADGTWNSTYGVTSEQTGSVVVDVDCTTENDGVVLDCHYGTSRTFMPNVQASAGAGASQTMTLSDLVAGVRYYFWINDATLPNNGRTGIYTFVTT